MKKTNKTNVIKKLHFLKMCNLENIDIYIKKNGCSILLENDVASNNKCLFNFKSLQVK